MVVRVGVKSVRDSVDRPGDDTGSVVVVVVVSVRVVPGLGSHS